jgi:hypothetical protein
MSMASFAEFGCAVAADEGDRMTKKLAILSIEDSNADFLLVERQLQTDGIDCQCQRVDD